MTITQIKTFNTVALLLLFLSFQSIEAQIKLTNNIGTTLVKTDMYSCDRDESWSRVFTLSDFGIAANEQFMIKSLQVGLSKSDIGSTLQCIVYSLDEDFPNYSYSIYPTTILGRRGIAQSPLITGAPEIVEVNFDEPIIVPAGVKRIMVSVEKYKDIYNPATGAVYIAGTEKDTGESWYFGCDPNHGLAPTTDLTIPVPNANFYINVTGEVFNVKSSGSITRLSHNVCDDLVETDIYSCNSTYIYWARAFTLKDFGISNNEEFVIKSGQVGINKTGWLANVSFNIYKIDDSFPASFSEADLIGSSQSQALDPYIPRNSQIIQVDFDTPIVIPKDVERILVEVKKGIEYGDGVAFIAGSAQDNDVSWQRGCSSLSGAGDKYVSTADFGFPKANFYINVTGNVNHVTNNFEMNFSNICSEFLKEFSVDDQSKIASISWDFGDPASGINNTSIDLSPFHDFSTDGKYTITATVIGNDGTVEVLTEIIDAKEPPKAYGINNIYACEESNNLGFSTSFDTSLVTQQVLGGQIDKVVTFIDGKGTKYNTLPNPFTNTTKNRETITVRVSHKDNFCCYSETTFDLIVNPLPDLSEALNLIVCDNDTDGLATFNLQQLKNSIIGTATNIKVEFYHENGQQIQSPLNAISNLIANEESIKVKAINTDTNCYNESTFNLIVNPLPIANSLKEITGCDDNNDGISEYFDTSNIESTVLGNQTGMKVTYFDTNGNQLPSPLVNPFTNSKPNQETITVRVTNPQTNCYSETFLNLITSTKPTIIQPNTLYACDEGNGFSHFDTSTIESELIGNQPNLLISYLDENGNKLPSPLPIDYKNTVPWSQTITARIENQLNSLCFSETNFKFVVNELPQINLEKEYFLCDLEPSLKITTDLNFDSWEWSFQDNSIISNSFEANLVEAGKYTLRVSKISNGISCENSFSFNLIRSILPKITEIKIQDLSDKNFIEIITSTNGDFEYAIDGNNFQDSNTFHNISGGVYVVKVRDKQGCGVDEREAILVDYPKFFTPNNDGYNDYWSILGIEKFPNSITSIFDRYGKLLKRLQYSDMGWDGTFNGENLIASDYWFTVELGNGRNFKGHFSLKR
ncbi:T9SS type B sorting domain-containing protein [Flavobacterium sp. WC2409]|uniref:T9SS type B sorting domain-containing protein n=1 Tax=Flavobacterium sp. WC2409 TaxID=3234139 RepID=A0AB39W694_9FLAO